MANMSYCRFHNTCIDLSDCHEALLNGGEISHSEEKKAKQLIRTCVEIIEALGGSVELENETIEEYFEEKFHDEEEEDDEEDDEEEEDSDDEDEDDDEDE